MIEEFINESNGNTYSGNLTSYEERRQHARYPFNATVEAVDTASQARIQGRASDLSQGGCYVDTISSFPAGSIVKMRVIKENAAFEAQAEVVYSMVGMGMGMKFIEVEPEQLGTVEKWLGELSGEMQPEPEAQQSVEPSCDGGTPANNDAQILSEVLNELLMELMRQGALPNGKCEALFRKLNRAVPSKSSSVQASKRAN